MFVLFFGFIIFILQRGKGEIKKEEENPYDCSVIVAHVKDYFHEYLNSGIETFRLSKEESMKVDRLRMELRKALNKCSYGDISSKIYVKEHIKDYLVNEYGLNRENINFILPFHNSDKLSHQDRFDILMYLYKKEFGLNAFHEFLKENHLLEDFFRKSDHPYEITGAYIDKTYEDYGKHLSFTDKLGIITQRIYQQYKGHGIIDELRDMRIDGISAGVSGSLEVPALREKENGILNSVWVFYSGIMIHLPFLKFSNEEELQRICRNIYRNGKPGQLSAVRGYIVNDMMDGSRIVVVRPPFAESWSFFVRKFCSKEVLKVEELITDENAELVIRVIELLIKGEQVIGITGEQGSGKTTLLKSLIGFISPNYTLRVQELVFELHLREIYPNRNIMSFRETEEIPGREGLDLQKKTDGTVNIIGEVASAPVASWLVMISQVASKFTIFTHHAKTTEHLIMSLRNDLMITGAFQNEKAAEEQVKESIRFDIHVVKNEKGHRYIERITEIIPEYEGSKKVKDIIKFIDGKYQIFEAPSKRTFEDISSHLKDTEIKKLRKLFGLEVCDETSF